MTRKKEKYWCKKCSIYHFKGANIGKSHRKYSSEYKLINLHKNSSKKELEESLVFANEMLSPYMDRGIKYYPGRLITDYWEMRRNIIKNILNKK